MPPLEFAKHMSANGDAGDYVRHSDSENSYWRHSPALLMTPLPASLIALFCSESAALPDTYRPGLRLNDYDENEASSVLWRISVHRRHVADRLRVAAALPPAALLNV